MRDLQKVVDACSERESRVKRLERENEFMLRLLVDIERAIDHGDMLQISVAIKRLRDILGTEAIMKDSIKPGLVRT